MKSKKLLFSTFTALVSISAYIVFSSSANASQGVMGAAGGAGGCNPCHGASSANTIIAFTGVPAAGYTPGTAYPVTLTITNSTKAKTGFDILFNKGAISNAPANTMLMAANKEMHHTNPFNATSGVTTINFTWTAPAAGSGIVILKTLANAVNNDQQTSGDDWAKSDFDLIEKPTTIGNQEVGKALQLYPNPVSNNATIQTSEKIISAQAIGMMGNRITVNIVKNSNDTYSIITNNLAIGNYILLLKGEKENFHSLLSKQ
jgi:hypothetical protein